MASTFAGMSSAGPLASPSTSSNKLSSVANISSTSFGSKRNVALRKSRRPTILAAAKELHFNKDGSAIKKLQVRFLTKLSTRFIVYTHLYALLNTWFSFCHRMV